MSICLRHLGPHAAPHLTDPARISLDGQGLIQECDRACESMLGYARAELAGHHVSLLVPKLRGIELVRQDHINPRLVHLCRCAVPFVARRQDGHCFASHLFFNLLNGGKSGLGMLMRGLDEANGWTPCRLPCQFALEYGCKRGTDQWLPT